MLIIPCQTNGEPLVSNDKDGLYCPFYLWPV